jgi:plastocyanin
MDEQGNSMNSGQTQRNGGKNLRRFVVVSALLVIGLAIVLVNSQDKKTNTGVVSAENTIGVDILAGKYDPSTIIINKGDSVSWINQDSIGHRVASNPYPKNDGLLGFDSAGKIAPGSFYSYTFTKTGTFGYHDQAKPTINGTVIVK